MAFAAKSRISLSVLFGTMTMLIGGCARQEVPPPSRPTVTVVALHPRVVSLTTEAPGRVSAFRIAEVRPQVSGILLSRLFNEGDDVAMGQRLYQIDPAPYEAALASARGKLEHARAEVMAAKLTVERYSALVDADAVSREAYDNAVATLKEDAADVTSAQASVRTAEIDLAYTKVYSPIGGRTGRSSVTEGALVTANQTTSLVTVTQLDPVYVDLSQPSSTLIRLERELAAGEIRRAREDKVPAKLLLEDDTRYDSTGTLEFSEVAVDQGTDSVTLRAIFPNPQKLLLPGMFVRATIEEGSRANAILAPQQGITHEPDGSATALVVIANDIVERRTVELDRAVGGGWLVTKGLAAGDRLIVAGSGRVTPGMRVTVREQLPRGRTPEGTKPSVAAR